MKYTFLKLSKQNFGGWLLSERDILRLPEQAFAYFVVVLAFVVLGPFNTYELSLPIRVLYWILMVGAAWVCHLSALMLVLRHPKFDNWRMTFRLGAMVLIAWVPTFLFASLVDWMFREEVMNLTVLMNTIFCTSIVASVLYFRIQSRIGFSRDEKNPDKGLFLGRIPAALGRDVMSITMQDHYVEVTTALGSTLMLMRFSDALEELAVFDGIQIHRSHWVEISAAHRLTRDNGKLMLELSDGRQLPVSRTFAQTVKSVLGGSARCDDRPMLFQIWLGFGRVGKSDFRGHSK